MRQSVAVVGHLHLFQTGHFFHVDVFDTLHISNDSFHFGSRRSQCRQVIPENLDGDVLPGSGSQFIETHLDGLLELELDASKRNQGFLHFGHQFLAGFGRSPFILVLQRDDVIACFHGGWVGRYFARADFADGVLDFRKGGEQNLIGFFNLFDGVAQRTALQGHDACRQVAFFQLRNELSTQSVENEQTADKKHEGENGHQAFLPQGKINDWLKALLNRSHHFV